MRLIFKIIISFLVALSLNSFAQTPNSIKKNYKKIIKLINEDNAIELSKMIYYPIFRDDPLPNIETKEEFIEKFHIIFDQDFKDKLSHYNDTVIFEHNGAYGLVGGKFSGDIWIDEKGMISTINYSSKEEKRIQNDLINNIKSKAHKSINNWDFSIITCKSKSLLVRIDYTDKGLRYVCWSKGKGISDKPDIILYHGVDEAQGTQGGWTYTFKNGIWTYIVDLVEMCETESECGIFLRLNKNNSEVKSIRMTRIK